MYGLFKQRGYDIICNCSTYKFKTKSKIFYGVFWIVLLFFILSYRSTTVNKPQILLNRLERLKHEGNTPKVRLHFEDQPIREEIRGGVLYRDITQFLNSTTDNVIIAPKVSYLAEIKNPCFAVDKRNMNAVNVTLEYVALHRLRVACLPYVYQAGFTKSGTSTLYAYMTDLHPYILRLPRKELHFWDNMQSYPYPWGCLRTLLGYFSAASRTIVDHVKTGSSAAHAQYIASDGTARTVWSGDYWQYDVLNHGLFLPEILTPQKLYHVSPQSRFIVLMRDPTKRLLSDYQYYVRNGRQQSTADFNDKVLRAITWWHQCLELHPEKRCLYGPTPNGLPTLDIDNCILNRTRTFQIKNTTSHSCYDEFQWTNNSAARLRVGLYERFIEEWLNVFPREHMLFIKSEEFYADPLKTLLSDVYPFLGLPNLTENQLERWDQVSQRRYGTKSSGNVSFYPETERILRQFYAPYNKRLSKTLGDKKWLWAD